MKLFVYLGLLGVALACNEVCASNCETPLCLAVCGCNTGIYLFKNSEMYPQKLNLNTDKTACIQVCTEFCHTKFPQQKLDCFGDCLLHTCS